MEHSALSFDRGGKNRKAFSCDGVALTFLAQKALQCLMKFRCLVKRRSSCLCRMVSPRTIDLVFDFHDGNEAGEDETITSFDDGYICTPTRRYPFSWLRKFDAELIITEKSAELETFLASLSTPFENRMNSINVRLQAIGFPIAVNTTTLEDREFVLRLTEGSGVPSSPDRSRLRRQIPSSEPHICQVLSITS